MMRTKKILFLLGLATTLSHQLHINAIKQERHDIYDCKTFEFNVGPILNYAHYEYGCLPALRGALAGIHLDLQHVQLEREYLALRFDGRWNAGSVSDCRQEKNRIQDYRAEFDLGYNYVWCNCEMRATPFAGVGFFYLANEDCHQNENKYYNIFVPFGVKYEWIINPCFKWGIEAEYRLDAWTRLTVEEECSTICKKTKLHPRTQGLLIELPFTWRAQKKCEPQIKLVPFFDWNRFGRSCEPSDSCSCSSPVLCALDSCEPSSCNVPRLNQWYVGAHLDFGIRF